MAEFNACPVGYQLAASIARIRGDLGAALRFENSGAAKCLGHNRADRHRERSAADRAEYERRTKRPYDGPHMATDADRLLYAGMSYFHTTRADQEG